MCAASPRPTDGNVTVLPPFLHLRSPQGYVVHLPVAPVAGNVFMDTKPVHLALFSAVPDADAGVVHLLFEFRWKEFKALASRYPASPADPGCGNRCVAGAP